MRVGALAALLLLVVSVGCDGGSKGGNADDRDAGQTGGDGSDGPAKNDGGTPPGDDAGNPQAGAGTVKGFAYALDKLSGVPVPLAGVTITGPGGETDTTDAKGAFTLKDVGAGNDVVLRAELAGYADSIRPVDVVKGETSFVEFFTKEITASATFSAEKGGFVKDPNSGASASFRPNSLKRKKDGKAATGPVTVEITTIDPTNPQELKMFPGHFQADKGGKDGLLETYAPMEVKVEDKDGNELTLKDSPDAKATVEFPFPTAVPGAPDKVDVWSLDEKSGKWKHEGTAVKGKDNNGKDVYTTTIAHLSWWNCDAFINAITCVRGCVTSDDAPVAGAAVEFLGLGWAFRGTDSTDAEGCFYANVQQSSQIAVFASAPAGVSDVKVATSDGESKRWEADPQACKNLGTFALNARDPNNPCPSGYSACENGGTTYCHDLRNDATKCGATCDTAVYCRGDFASGAVCVQGQCECPNGWLNCDFTPDDPYPGQCVNAQVSEQQCGASCNDLTQCDQLDVCVGGACEALTCAQGQTACRHPYDSEPSCVDLETSVKHCGECNNTCGPYEGTVPFDSPYQCVDGTCGCKTGFTDCSNVDGAEPYCLDLQNDPGACGGCPGTSSDVICADNQACVKGKCVALDCPVEEQCSPHACSDLASDEQNCGECGTFCYEQQQCNAGKCECVDANLTLCNNFCTNTDLDEYNCGGCNGAGGVQCEPGEMCVGGACEPLDCGGLTACGSLCVDTQADEYNCGGCGLYCGGTCTAGTCTCPDGQFVCGAPMQKYCSDTACP